MVGIPGGKIAYIQKDHVNSLLSLSFVNCLNESSKLLRYFYDCKEFLKIQDHFDNILSPVNIENVVTVDDPYLLRLVVEEQYERPEQLVAMQN